MHWVDWENGVNWVREVKGMNGAIWVYDSNWVN